MTTTPRLIIEHSIFWDIMQGMHFHCAILYMQNPDHNEIHGVCFNRSDRMMRVMNIMLRELDNDYE